MWSEVSTSKKMADKVVSLDYILEKALKECGVSSAQDAVVIALHSNFLAAGYQCVGIGDEVIKGFYCICQVTSTT